MQIECFHFDKIFDVVALYGAFSFKSGNRVEYAASLDQRIVPAEGDAYAVAFGRPRDWSTVLGWRDLRGTTVTLKYPLWSWGTVVDLNTIVMFSPAFFFTGLLLGGLGAAMALLVIPVAIAAYRLLRLTQSNRQVLRELRALDVRTNNLQPSHGFLRPVTKD